MEGTSDSVTTLVMTAVSRRVVVCVIWLVTVCVEGAAVGAASVEEPPSTATTEYVAGIRLSSSGCACWRMGEALVCRSRAARARTEDVRDVFMFTGAETEEGRETRSNDLLSASHGQCKEIGTVLKMCLMERRKEAKGFDDDVHMYPYILCNRSGWP